MQNTLTEQSNIDFLPLLIFLTYTGRTKKSHSSLFTAALSSSQQKLGSHHWSSETWHLHFILFVR